MNSRMFDHYIIASYLLAALALFLAGPVFAGASSPQPHSNPGPWNATESSPYGTGGAADAVVALNFFDQARSGAQRLYVQHTLPGDTVRGPVMPLQPMPTQPPYAVQASFTGEPTPQAVLELACYMDLPTETAVDISATVRTTDCGLVGGGDCMLLLAVDTAGGNRCPSP